MFPNFQRIHVSFAFGGCQFAARLAIRAFILAAANGKVRDIQV